MFEAMSGMTTTGTTVIVGLDDLPRVRTCGAASCNGWGALGSSSWR
jgi:Trk-type K+ transport system membrane component